ncbi:unnamed protein product, partial [Rotaria magnacalcarata]
KGAAGAEGAEGAEGAKGAEKVLTCWGFQTCTFPLASSTKSIIAYNILFPARKPSTAQIAFCYKTQNNIKHSL